jgi:hypothetical protein
VIRPGLLAFTWAAWLLSAAPVYAGGLSTEVDGIEVELTSSPSRPGAKNQTEYVVRLVDRPGRPVTSARVTLRGAMSDGMSVVAPLRPAGEAGVYRGRVLYTMEGQWELTLRVSRDGARFELPLTERVGR